MRRPKASAALPLRGRAAGIAVLVAVTLAAAAGGPRYGDGRPMAGPPSAEAAGPVTLEFWTISLQPFFTKFINGLIDGYQRAHPGVRIRWIDVQPQALDQKLLSAIAGGVAPDVVNLNTETTLRLAQERALLDMDGAVPADARARYFPNIWASLRLDGRAYGVPWYVTPDVLAYNQALFAKAGLNPAHPPATTDDLIRAAVVVKKKTGVYGFMPNVDGIRFLKVFQEEGLPVLSPDRRRAVFDTPSHVALLARYVDLLKHDEFPDDTLRRGYLGATERYGGGQLAMLTTGPQFLLRVRTDNPDVYRATAVASAPLGRGRVLDLPTMDLAVPVSSRHHDEAVAFALYVTDDANQLAFSKQVDIFPSTRAAAADSYFTKAGTSPEDRARVVAARELGTAKDLTVVVPHSDDLYRVFREAIESAFYGKMNPAQALQWAVREWNKRL
ncbi:MAG TPA: sugar ABC transporter substrate-binding protein [bacterium]|nr:sugar ABC transporter substrate-binding protein [bacterium]